MHTDNEIVNRFTIAAHELLREQLAPEFAEDAASLVFVAGPPLDATKLLEWTNTAKQFQHDLIYLTFEPGRERFGPSSIAVFAERWGAVFRWTDCVLWAPKDGGPCRVMHKGLNVCFSHDGKALNSHPERPTGAFTSGIVRARRRLQKSAAAIPQQRLAEVEAGWKQAA